VSKPAVLVLRAPGINCERETLHGFELAGATCEYVHIKRLIEHPDLLDNFSILAIPGGFAYGDDIAAGLVLANEMKRRMGERLLGFIDRGGLALGVCNGFQVMVRLGLLPRTGGNGLRQEITLSPNLSNHYECRWVTLKSQDSRCAFLEPNLELRLPAAHGEGYLMTPDEQTSQLLSDEGYVALCYTDTEGSATEVYPTNPNGSPGGVAGLTDVTGRVLGLMPHPDRAYLPFHMPQWRRDGLAEQGDGMAIFASMVELARAEG